MDRRPYTTTNAAEQLDRLIEKNSKASGMKYLFVDEIQNVKGFETVINSWREEGDYSIFITGSNSYLLSGELVTKLTGRYLEFNILPLTLEEFVGMKMFFGKEVPADKQDILSEYIYEGGFPYAVRLDSLKDKRAYVTGLIEEIYQKDIRSRIQIRNRTVFDAVLKYIVNNYGATTSIESIVKDFRKNNVSVKRETIARYIKALENAKIISECRRFDMKSRKSLRGEKKYYLSDLSFFFAMNTDNRINFGPVLENIVYNYAFSMGYSISIGKIGKLECDFILRDTELNYAYVQVAYTILESKATEDREYRSLEAITGDNYPRYVMTTDRLIQYRNGINHVNLIDFILENKSFK